MSWAPDGDRVGGDGYVRVSEKVEKRLMIIDDEYIRMIRGEKVRTIFPLIIELVILLLLFNPFCWDIGKLNYWMASGAIRIYLFLPGVPFTKKRREKRKKREYLATGRKEILIVGFLNVLAELMFWLLIADRIWWDGWAVNPVICLLDCVCIGISAGYLVVKIQKWRKHGKRACSSTANIM